MQAVLPAAAFRRPIAPWSSVLRLEQQRFRLAVFGLPVDQLRPILEALIESLQIELLHGRGHRIRHRLAQAVRIEHMRHRRKEAHHDDVQHHLPAEFLRQSRRRDAVEPDPLRRMIDPHQFLLHNQDPAGLQLRREDRVRFLAHHHQDVRLGHVWVQNRLARKNHLRGRRPSARLRPEALRHRGVAAFEDRRRLPDHRRRQNHALPAEARDADFRQSELAYPSLHVVTSGIA